MLLKSLTLAAAGLAAATQAFLLPPEITQSDIDIVDSLPVDALIVPQNVDVELSCPGCLLQAEGGHHDAKVASEKPSHLDLAFSIDHDRLVVNGYPLYPKANPFLISLTASLVPDDSTGATKPEIKEHRGHRRPRPEEDLGYQLAVRQPATTNEDGLALIEVDLQILQVGDAFVNGIPNVHVTLVKDISTGAIVIGSIGQTESKAVVSTPMSKQEECSTFMCEWIAGMKDSMAKMKGKPCHGKMRGGAKAGGSHPHHDRPHRHHKGRPNKMEGNARNHSWGKLFKNIVNHILLPAAVGIIAGVTASLVGMMAGTLIVSVWRMCFRRSSRRRHSRSHSHCRHKAPTLKTVAAALEKAGLMENQELPPSYEEDVVPSYEVTVPETPKADA